MVDVMQPDVAGEELQHSRQPEVGAAAERRVQVTPASGTLPVGVFELMLDVEEPDANRAGEDRRRCPDEQEALPANQPAQPADDHDKHDIRAKHAVAHPGTL